MGCFMLMEFTGITVYHTILKLQCQLGGNTFQGWGMVLQKAVYVLDQHLIYGTV